MPVIAAAIARIAAAAQETDLQVDRILDVGSGPGVAAIALAVAFPGAMAVAVDTSAPLLDLVHDRAVAHGVAGRVHTEVADLEQPLEVLGAADVVWASMVLHHVASPADTLRQLRSVLRPGGRLCALVFPVGKAREEGGPPYGTTTEDLAAVLPADLRLALDVPVVHRAAKRVWPERWAEFAR